jgi:hypothetical protein
MKRAYRVFTWAMLVASVITIVAALHKPRTYVSAPVTPAAQAKHAQDFSDKLQQLEDAKQRGEDARANISSEEITSAITQALMQQTGQSLPAGTQIAPAGQAGQSASDGQASTSGQESSSQAGYGSNLASDPNAAIAAGDVNMGQIKEPLVTFEGDEVKGRFLTNVHGKDVYITISGHLGSKDGYVTFDPTGFQVGDLPIPVSLVNPALQQKLADPENRDKLRLPDFISGLRVENGELIVDQKK